MTPRDLAFEFTVGGLFLIVGAATMRAFIFGALIDRCSIRLPLLATLCVFAMGAAFLLAGIIGFFAGGLPSI